jgi:hypothetical protein
MKKLIWLALIILLAACGSADNDAATLPVGTAVTAPTDGDDSAETDNTAAVAQPGTAAEFVTAVTIEQAAQTKPTDQTKGATDPLVTIIEYGDFQ